MSLGHPIVGQEGVMAVGRFATTSQHLAHRHYNHLEAQVLSLQLNLCLPRTYRRH